LGARAARSEASTARREATCSSRGSQYSLELTTQPSTTPGAEERARLPPFAERALQRGRFVRER